MQTISTQTAAIFDLDAPACEIRESLYTVRFARTDDEIDEALRLRFDVFNIELNEGLEASYISGRDEDEFDQTCHHLIVFENSSGRMIGTYRVRTIESAKSAFGFYSAGEFSLEDLPFDMLAQSLEIGRACIRREHRNSRVLFLLWKGLSMFATARRKRYFFGCCSLPSQDCTGGIRVMRSLVRANKLHDSFRVSPRDDFRCVAEDTPVSEGNLRLPPLFDIYLRTGAKICGEPAIDRQFKTIDFFVVVDIRELPLRYKRLFFS